ncbi:MAG TPA: methyltransferase domain-containing protein, partial [Pseudonocardia sp.]|nr:methyltransferase domain-containing protein [Pseudonocardia sp.]
MTAEDRSRWDARHAAVVDDVSMPPDELRGRTELLPAGGRALDVACGRGAVAVWLAGRGFTVDAVDVSPVALAAAAALAGRHRVADR